MVITALKQQIKNTERVSVFIDGKYTFSLTLNQIVSEKIKVGLEIDQDALDDYKEKSTNEKLRQKALNWVMSRPHSVRELQDYLKRTTYRTKYSQSKTSTLDTKNISQNALGDIVEEFSRRGWVDDLVFAKWWVERNSRANRSKSFLKSELMQKGVAKDIIDDLLTGKDETEVIADLVRKCRTKLKYQDNQKLFRYLLGKGFGYSSVADALKLGAEDREA